MFNVPLVVLLIGLGAVLRARSTARMRRIATAVGGAIVAVFLAAARGTVGQNCLYFETGQGAALSAEAARLGERVFVLTGQGLSEVAVEAPEPIPRAPDTGETLAVTGRLTRLLLDAA